MTPVTSPVKQATGRELERPGPRKGFTLEKGFVPGENSQPRTPSSLLWGSRAYTLGSDPWRSEPTVTNHVQVHHQYRGVCRAAHDLAEKCNGSGMTGVLACPHSETSKGKERLGGIEGTRSHSRSLMPRKLECLETPLDR